MTLKAQPRLDPGHGGREVSIWIPEPNLSWGQMLTLPYSLSDSEQVI